MANEGFRQTYEAPLIMCYVLRTKGLLNTSPSSQSYSASAGCGEVGSGTVWFGHGLVTYNV